ncbi:hypothetical protein MEO40_17865 [Dolichospermum sp. ST_sed1]|nr:hypothetical protein [Dolichospermum sp. ST_sed1]MDD1424503.1 hypothetical protein [Dolichospermum sp. ST_sed9]MDD1429651.1 hypothetical protein [Dolichospermum sp. ST_sed6]MDD1440122.1 hypothetical protein [Dolichospermum sp. ST_sed3]MDD1448024.1 hypothetical protein [Dolichospermum sp. ST_sed8]MDD1456667.1 hypothetical protein [Dolichospermum sp. ST_sed7]MDD1462264.1 hypothetical protein [Dolichospermum sp. ST_sed2]MDD1466346.1 hypothetical protein [Dolichospermum sp. ST_sed5]MDD147327
MQASCPRERDAHTTVRHFYLDKLLVQYGVNKTTILNRQKAYAILLISLEQEFLVFKVR